MTYLVERLAELRRHLDHLYERRKSISSADDLRRDLSLHNDVLFSLLQVCQGVIDIAGELSSRKGLRFEDYTEAVRNLSVSCDLREHIADRLAELPGFRNVLIHEYLKLDLERAVAALEDLEPVERLIEVVSALEREESS